MLQNKKNQWLLNINIQYICILDSGLKEKSQGSFL